MVFYTQIRILNGRSNMRQFNFFLMCWISTLKCESLFDHSVNLSRTKSLIYTFVLEKSCNDWWLMYNITGWLCTWTQKCCDAQTTPVLINLSSCPSKTGLVTFADTHCFPNWNKNSLWFLGCCFWYYVGFFTCMYSFLLRKCDVRTKRYFFSFSIALSAF